MPKRILFLAIGLIGLLFVASWGLGGRRTVFVAQGNGGIPTCNGQQATMFIDGAGKIVGGPDNGETYNGLLNGTTGSDVIVGTSGVDTIHGKQGSDVVCAGDGDDTITGDRGNDTIFGEGGADNIDGNEEDDLLVGGEGNDRIDGGYGVDMIHGDGGNDTINGNQNNDSLFGGDGDDSVDGGYGDDDIEGNGGADILKGNPGIDLILGGSGDDDIDGGDGADILCGNSNNDILAGHEKDDQLDGGPDIDTLDGHTGTDVCRNGETYSNCEDMAPGFIVACNDSVGSTSSSASSLASSSSQVASTTSSSASSISSSSASSSASSSESASPPPSSSSSTSSSSSSVVTGNGQNGRGLHASGIHSGHAMLRGRGLAEQAAALHSVFQKYGLHQGASYQYTFHHENIRPESFVSGAEAEDWTLREHAACCSMFRYLQRFRERQHVRSGYIDWIAGQVATAVQEDRTEIKAALLGQPHAHASDFVRSITAKGCAENPYVNGVQSPLHAEHVLDLLSKGESLTIRQEDIPGEIAFVIRDGEKIFTEYGVSHTKAMHVIVVRDDLRYFSHIHPERDSGGVWRVSFLPPAGGTYWIYADFIGRDERAHTIRFERMYDGDRGEIGLQKDTRTEKGVGNTTAHFEATPYANGTLFTVRLQDLLKRDVRYVEEYLGAEGHSIIVSPDGDFIHTHPSPAGDTLTFHGPVLTGKFYRIFMQFQIRGEVLTVEFDWEP